jgi:hypothetical protein
LVLAGAVNTAIIGSNGVLNRVAEDGVLPNYFRLPHPKFGTTNRIINLVVALQLLAILISQGNVMLLGEAYAFGVVWSFAMKALAVVILCFKQPEARVWKVPLNIRVGSVAFFTMFEMSERYNRRHRASGSGEREEFLLKQSEDLSPEIVQTRPGNVLVPVRNPHHLSHLEKTLAGTDTNKEDVVVVSVNLVSQAGSGEHDLRHDQMFGPGEIEVFTKVVSVAEKAGKHVELLAVAGTNPWLAIA